ncbi:hypothetical protein V6Z11_A11G226300 [Gossypium hirsutum]
MMITTSLFTSPLLHTSTLLIISLCFLLLSPVSSLRHLQSSTSPDRGLSFVEKIRLGSTPPSCHNKCNGCHPCMAVQVPTIPSHNRFQPDIKISSGANTDHTSSRINETVKLIIN